MDINKIKIRIKNIKKGTNKTDSPLLFRHTFKINLDYNILLSKLDSSNDILYMKFPDSKNSYFGFDTAIEYNINSKNEFNKLEKTNHETISNVKNDNVILFGFSSFDMDVPSKKPWAEIPRAYFFIPKFLITFTNNTCYLTYTLRIDTHFSEKNVINDFNKISNIIDNKIKENYKEHIIFIEKTLIPDKKTYLNDIKNVLKQLNKNKYSKIVLSRIEKYSLSKKIPLNLIIQLIIKEYPECFNFLIKKKEYCFTGSTPEELIKINNKNYYTHALAGTSKHKNSLNSKKELEEHEYVINHIKNILDPISDKIIINKNSKPLKLEYAYHIKTPINGKFKKQEHVLNILKKLSPTPALAGSPIEHSKNVIKRVEKFDRGWYGGSAGIYTNNGNGKFYVPIRSCLIKNTNIYFYSGGGIVDKSDSDKEWQETKLKLQHMKKIINQLIQDKIN